jgi:hypothetical protein
MELPDLASRAELVRRYAHLLQHFGSEIGERPLVRQNNTFFPDPFAKDEASVTRLVRRLALHGGLDDIPLAVRLLSLEGPLPAEGGDASGCGPARSGAAGCGSAGCAPTAVGTTASPPRLVERDEGWVLNVFDAELHHPVALTCTLARSLARLFLAETASATAPVEEPLEVSVDLACVALGFGTLVLEGSYIYAKSCGGPSVTQLTRLGVGELAVACSLFIAIGGHSGRRATAELGTTQRVLLAEANDWAASNAPLIERLATSPGQLASSVPTLTDTKPWLLRLFQRPRVRPSEPSLERALAGELGDAELLELAQAARGDKPGAKAAGGPQRPAPDSRRDELRALVDEALGAQPLSPR